MIRLILIALLAFCCSKEIKAQTPFPDPEYQRQQERERVLRRQQEPPVDARMPASPAEAGDEVIPEQETPCFPITSIVLQGEQAAQFAYALKAVTQGAGNVLGRCLGVGGIKVVLARVQNRLIAQGYVTTRVLTGPQDLSHGELQLTVLPGHVRTIRFAADASPRGTLWNAVPLQPGDILNLRDIEQGLENFKRVPTAEADIQIVPTEGAARPGDSDLVIAYQQAFPFRLSTSIDNSGSDTTGKYQGSVTLSYDNWWTLNDLFYVSVNHDLGGGNSGVHGTSASTVHYAVPFGYWSLETTSSRNEYHQGVAGVNQTYVYRGQSENSEIKLSRLVFRDATRKLTLSLKGFLKTSSNYIDDTEVEVQRRRTAGWEMGAAYQELFGASTLVLSVAYRHGTGAFSAMTAPEDAFGEGTARFKVWTAEAGLAVPMNLTLPWGKQSVRYDLTARGQWNSTPLTPQERFSIGGRYTVRGFDGEQTLLADSGWLLRNNLSAALGASGQELYLGLDYGQVGGPSSSLLAGTRLAGAVVGMRGNYQHFSYDLFAGTSLSKPNNFQTVALTLGFSLNCAY